MSKQLSSVRDKQAAVAERKVKAQQGLVERDRKEKEEREEELKKEKEKVKEKEEDP